MLVGRVVTLFLHVVCARLKVETWPVTEKDKQDPLHSEKNKAELVLEKNTHWGQSLSTTTLYVLLYRLYYTLYRCVCVFMCDHTFSPQIYQQGHLRVCVLLNNLQHKHKSIFQSTKKLKSYILINMKRLKIQRKMSPGHVNLCFTVNYQQVIHCSETEKWWQLR